MRIRKKRSDTFNDEFLEYVNSLDSDELDELVKKSNDATELRRRRNRYYNNKYKEKKAAKVSEKNKAKNRPRKYINEIDYISTKKSLECGERIKEAMKKAEQIKNQFRDASHMKDFNVAVNSLDSSFSRLEELLQDIRFSRSKLLTKLKDKSDVITKRYFSLLDNCSLFEEGWLAVYADFSEFATEWISFKNTKLKLNEKAATGDYNKHLKEVYGVDTVKNHLAFMNRWNNAVPEIQKLVLDIDTALDYILLEVRNNL